jgi:hypothetical protein
MSPPRTGTIFPKAEVHVPGVKCDARYAMCDVMISDIELRTSEPAFRTSHLALGT